MDALGFHPFDEYLFNEEEYDFGEFYYDAQNFLNVLGWFPGLGTPIGIIRISSNLFILATDDNRGRGRHKRYYLMSIVRGVVEIVGLGFFFLIPDIVSSFRKHRKAKKAAKKERKRALKKDKAEK